MDIVLPRGGVVVGLGGAVWVALILGRARAIAFGVVIALAMAAFAAPASRMADRAAYTLQFSGTAITTGQVFRLDLRQAPAFRVTAGLGLPVGLLDAKVTGVVGRPAIGAPGALGRVQFGAGAATVSAMGQTLYQVPAFTWVGSPGGHGVAIGGVRNTPVAKKRVAPVFVALVRIERVMSTPGVLVARVSGTATVGEAWASWSGSRPGTW